VLEEPAEHAAHADVVGQPGHSRTQGADAAHPHVDRDAGLGRAVEGIDGRLVDDRVALERDAGREPGAVVLDLAVDALDESRAHRVRRDEEAAVLRLHRVARQHVEQTRDVLADLGVGGEEADVLVQARGLRVVVARADVDVAAQLVAVVANDHRELAVGLEPDEPVDDVAAGLLELAGPVDVGLLVEPGLDLDDREHLLALLRRGHEGVDDGGVATGAVEGLLDREDLRVGRGLLQEPLDARGERVVRVVQQHVVVAHGLEHVGRGRGVDVGELAARARQERRELEVVAGEAVDGPERREVEQARDAHDLLAADPELADQQVEHVRVDRLRDLQAHRRPEAAAHELALERLQEVLCVVLLDLEVLVARDAERVVLQHLHAGEELAEVRGDDVLERHEPLGPDDHEPLEDRRHLHAGEELGARRGVPHDDREVEGEARDVRERVGRVDRQRREDREHLVLEERGELVALGLGCLVPAQDLDALGSQRRLDLVVEQRRLALHQLGALGVDALEDLARHRAAGRAYGDPRRDAPLEAGDAHHEELVEVAREDGEELGALEEREVRVLGQLEHALVEREPRQLAVEEAVVGQRRRLLGLRGHLGGQGCRHGASLPEKGRPHPGGAGTAEVRPWLGRW